jgi:hypothetical protein
LTPAQHCETWVKSFDLLCGAVALDRVLDLALELGHRPRPLLQAALGQLDAALRIRETAEKETKVNSSNWYTQSQSYDFELCTTPELYIFTAQLIAWRVLKINIIFL